MSRWQPATERVWSRFTKDGPNGCWQWLGAPNDKGYGQISVNSRPTRAHRVVYELLRGPIPEGLVLDHLCRNTMCVNPDHLEPVTQRTNILRGVGATARHARQGACKRGHPFDAANTYRKPTDGGRICRTCVREWEDENRQRRTDRRRELRRSWLVLMDCSCETSPRAGVSPEGSDPRAGCALRMGAPRS